MIAILLGIIAACAIGVVIEGYFLIGQYLLIKSDAEQTLNAARRLLATIPGKSAEPEDGSSSQPWPKFAKLRAGAERVDARMQPTFLEPEPATEPVPVVRPSPVPREPAPLVTEPMEIADELAADAHAYVVLTEQQQWEADQEAKYAAAMARIEEMAKGLAG